MRFIYIFVISPLFLFSQESSLSPKEVILKMNKNIETVESFQYTTSFEHKKFGHEKSDIKKFKIYAQKNKKNNDYFFDWKIEEENSPITHLYVGNNFYYSNRNRKWVTIYKDFGELEVGNYSEFIRLSNLFNEVLLKISLQKIKRAKFSTEYQDEKFWIIEYEGKNGYELIWVDKTTFFPMKRIEVLKHKKLEQIFTTKIMNFTSNITFSSDVFNTSFSERNFDVKYIYKSDLNENLTLSNFELDLSPNQVDTLLNKKLTSPTNTTFKLKNSKSNLILVDFWFVSCIPCLNSMPSLQELHNKYSDEGLEVIGINCHDKDEIENVTIKINELGINYKNYFSSKALCDFLNIKAFPSIILINSEGEILYSGLYISKDEIENLILSNL